MMSPIPGTRDLMHKTRNDAIEHTLQRLTTHGVAETAARTQPLTSSRLVAGRGSSGRWTFGDPMGSKPLG